MKRSVRRWTWAASNTGKPSSGWFGAFAVTIALLSTLALGQAPVGSGATLETRTWHYELEHSAPHGGLQLTRDGSSTLRTSDFVLVYDPESSDEAMAAYLITGLTVAYESEDTETQYDMDGKLEYSCDSRLSFEGSFSDPAGLGNLFLAKEENDVFGLPEGGYWFVVGWTTDDAHLAVDCTGPLSGGRDYDGPWTFFMLSGSPLPGSAEWSKVVLYIQKEEGVLAGEIDSTQEDARCSPDRPYDVVEQVCRETWLFTLP